MSEAVVAGKKPKLVRVESGRTYFWCACGLSARQPFCDGSHKTTDIEPVKWQATADEDRLFCICKQSAAAPFCDGSHNRLSDTYETAGDDGAAARLVDYRPVDGGALKAELDNGCYVVRVPEQAFDGTFRLHPLISAADGANDLSQFAARVAGGGTSPVIRYPGSDAVLFVSAGEGRVRIADREFPIAPETGVSVRPGEGFQLINDGREPLDLSIAVCPHCAAPEFPETMPAQFDDAVPERTEGVDTSKQEAMGDRFFQVLIDSRSHRTPVTQFIGEIPLSRAAHHRHLYEETITILSGEGFMWTDETKAPVQPGDTIFLPLKQAHSLQCTSEGGMRLVGLFYPSMSPAINY